MGNLLIDLCQSFTMLIASWWIYAYYIGKVKYTEEKEKHRLRQVQKYGKLFLVCSIGAGSSGLILCFLTFYDIYLYLS